MTIKNWIRNTFTWITCTVFGATFIVIIILFGSLITFFIGGPGGLSMSAVTTKLNELQIANAKIIGINVGLEKQVGKIISHLQNVHNTSSF